MTTRTCPFLPSQAATHRDTCERELKKAAETGEYAIAEARQVEITRLANEMLELGEQLKILSAQDERRRNELPLLGYS